MGVTRREFLAVSGALGAGLALSSLGIDTGPLNAYAEEISKIDRIKSAKQTYSTLLLLLGRLRVDLQHRSERRAKSSTSKAIRTIPSTKGSLCAKGAGIFQMSARNEHRLTKVLYPGPGSDKWEPKTLDWALTQIAKKIKATRDEGLHASRTTKGRWSTGSKPLPTWAAPSWTMKSAG